jgi:hypothetical protein
MTRTSNTSSDAKPFSRGWDRPITKNERAWIEIIRLASWDTDPKPTLARVQQVRRAFERVAADEEPE